jgi:coenzyme F420-reducing hydrogenase beta subunit
MEGADMKFGDNVIAVRTETGEHLLREAIRDGYVQIRRESSTDELARGQHIAERVRQVLRYTDGLRGVPGEEEKRIRRFITRDQAKPAAIRREAQKILWKTRIKDIVKRILHR